MKIICRYCKGLGHKLVEVGGRHLKFPCGFCGHKGYTTIKTHLKEYGLKHLIKTIKGG